MALTDGAIEAIGGPLAKLCLGQRRKIAELQIELAAAERRERDVAHELTRSRLAWAASMPARGAK